MVSYFDHVRCSSCKAMLDPESLGGRPGEGLTCPRCGEALALGDLFGLKDSFAEEDAQEMSFDDLASVQAGPAARGPARPGPGTPGPGAGPASRSPAARSPAARAPAAPTASRAGSPAAPTPARGGTPAGPSRATPAPSRAGGTAMVRQTPVDDDDSDEAAPPRALPGPAGDPQPPPKKGSALDAMRKMKKR